MSNDLFSAEKESPIIINYINTIDSLNNIAINNLEKTKPKVDPRKAIAEEMNPNDLKHLAGLMFKATDLDYIAIMDSGYSRYLKSNKKDMYRINLMGTPAVIQSEMKQLISPLVYALTRVAYFLHVRVDSVKTVIPTEEGVIHGEKPIINATIIKVYKGHGRFKTGDNVQFYSYKFWQKERHTFTVGKEYFVPLEPRGDYPFTNEDSIALVSYLDDSNGYYPIKNGFVTDKYNFFGFGIETPYYFFNKKLKDKIEELKSW